MENSISQRVFRSGQVKLCDLDGGTSIGNIDNLGAVEWLSRTMSNQSIDYTALRGDLRVLPHWDGNGGLVLKDMNRNHSGWEFSNWGIGQLCNTVDIPVKYVKKCIDEGDPDLASTNINRWLSRVQPSKEQLIRTTNSRVHGFLSSSYGILDDMDIIDATKENLNDDEYIVKNYCVDPEFFNMRIVRKDLMDINGEELSVGLNIKNSMVGRSMVNIQVMIYRWICKNGVIFGGGAGTVFAKKHINITREDFITGMNDSLEKIPYIVNNAKQWVESSRENVLNSNSLQKIIDELKDAKFSDLFLGKVKDSIPETPTRWDVVNAMTMHAQAYSFDTREKIEQYAGLILAA
jgi:hypothetical protein